MTSVQGTPSYMAPEQHGLGPEGVGPPADIWAFGATLVHLLSGRPPFSGLAPAEVVARVAHLRQPPELPLQVRAGPGPWRLGGHAARGRSRLWRLPRVLQANCRRCMR
jgi:serine/threonine protein kinase